MPVNLYVVGKIVGCFGLKGDLKIQPMTHSTERLKKLRTVFLGVSADETAPYDVEQLKLKQGLPLIKFSNVSDRTSAEPLVGKFIYVSEEDLARPPQGSYFTHDIIGCEVRTTDGRFLGTVEEIYNYPAQDVWVVRNGMAEYMIPAVKEFIATVDLKQRTIVVNAIDGLIEEGRKRTDV
jgi:16S rRNA processing protein RimM